MEIYVEWTEGLFEDERVCALDVFSTKQYVSLTLRGIN